MARPRTDKKEWWVRGRGPERAAPDARPYRRDAPTSYFRAFQKQWQFINDYQRDADFHGLHEMIDGEGRPVAGGKGRIWKEGYHEGRALLNVTARLQKLAQAGR